MSEVWLIRHGETEWSKSGQHTGRADIPLTANGERQAAELGRRLAGRSFDLVLVSPLRRAIETCRLAGYLDVARIDPDLREWDYGAYEGRTSDDIRRDRPGWVIWSDGVERGETVEQVGERAARVIARAEGAGGPVALFAHGHVLRILTACWLGLPPRAGELFPLDTGTVSILGHEREARAVSCWNCQLCGE